MRKRDRVFKMITLGLKQMQDPYYQGFAAQLSFYFILALVPIILLISQVLTSIFKQNLEDAIGWIMDYIGTSGIGSYIEKLVIGNGGGAMSLVFIIIAVWAASRVQFSMMRITNYTFSDGQSTGKGFLRDRIRAFATMGLTVLTIVFAIIVLLYGDVILSTVLKIIGKESDATDIWMVLRWPIAIVLYFLMISFNYYVLPMRRMKFREIIPGSIFASVGLLIVSYLYSKYAFSIANYSLLYGSLATIVALLFWFYFLAWVLFLGILVNKVWADTKTY